MAADDGTQANSLPQQLVQLASCVRKLKKRKEVNKMDYVKPQIVLGGRALTIIQGSGKPENPNQDNNGDFNCSIPAYEADE